MPCWTCGCLGRQIFKLRKQLVETVAQGIGLIQVDAAITQQAGLQAMGLVPQLHTGLGQAQVHFTLIPGTAPTRH
jgi:hypothetical protein